MPRWSQHAEDSFRLPEGFKRIGYDADTMRYTFTDKHGKLYRSAPGEEYGTLMPITFSASTDRPKAFSDEKTPKGESTGPALKLTFSDFLPPSAMTSATSSLDQYAPAPPPSAYLTGAVRTALPKMQGVVQSIHRTITSAYTKGSPKHVSAPTPHVSPFPLHPQPPHKDENVSSNTASAVDGIDASVQGQSKSPEIKA
ncbi:hypothetical protein IW261DRAFT_1608132 [Armillaria novae-zelandiae]|uniref:Uncharacterized protein n=1 Tax=Armillaria novae-zelandiae TaxID=153914 RepID=A0AA39P8T7_9AGAR|nr:hypothetical protein IW261DRAFT_1608132 [Armillaria novae-zelandiae]